MKQAKLTDMQEAFCRHYAAQPAGEKNATLAMQQAGSAATGASLRVFAMRTLRSPKIMRRIMELDPRHEIERTGVDAAWLLNEYAQLVDVSLDDLYDDSGELRPWADIPASAKKLIKSVTRDGDRVKVELIDRLAVLRDIGKHVDVRAFTESKADQVMDSLAALMSAATRALDTPPPIDIEVLDDPTPTLGLAPPPSSEEGPRASLSKIFEDENEEVH